MEAEADRALTLPTARHLTVSRTARYYVLASGAASAAPREVWFVVHGYGQLAGRFLRHFAPLDDGTRCIVAPEALSRFYLDHPGKAGSAATRVGATWMTREDRDAEIADHVAYLDALAATVADAFEARPSLHVLGFSQGVATVSRWLTHGRTRADHVVFWAGRVPPDVFPLAAGNPMRDARIDIVTGDDDEFATDEVRADQRVLLERSQLSPHIHRFAGGHVMDSGTLQRIAADAAGISARGGGR